MKLQGYHEWERGLTSGDDMRRGCGGLQSGTATRRLTCFLSNRAAGFKDFLGDGVYDIRQPSMNAEMAPGHTSAQAQRAAGSERQQWQH